MRRRTRIFSTLTAAVLVVAGAVASVPSGHAATPSGVQADCGAATAEKSTARLHLETLAAASRPYGTAAERAAATYISSELAKCGYAVTSQTFKAGGKKTSANVIAVAPVPGATAEIIVGAHYDSATTAKGADDNASGVAAMLALAARIAKGTVTPKYTVKFVAFGAEESSTMYGSYQFVKYFVRDGRDIQDVASGVPIAAMINLDALAAGDIAYVHGNDENPAGQALIDWASGLVSDQGLGLDYNGNDAVEGIELANTAVHEKYYLWDDSDYFWFYDAGVPFLYLEATNWTVGALDGFTQVAKINGAWCGRKGAIYHTSYDTVAYIDGIPEYNGGSNYDSGITCVSGGDRINTRMAGFGKMLDAFVSAEGIPVPGATTAAG